MTIISTEMLKWKRNKTVLGIFILTAILGIFAVERAFSISRSSSLMNSFSDLYTLAFKNLTSLFLPIVLSMFATTLFFDEQKNDTLKGLRIIIFSRWRVSSTCNAPRYFFSNIGKGICSTDWGCITLSCACRAYSVGDYGTAPTGECYGNLSLYFI